MILWVPLGKTALNSISSVGDYSAHRLATATGIVVPGCIVAEGETANQGNATKGGSTMSTVRINRVASKRKQQLVQNWTVSIAGYNSIGGPVLQLILLIYIDRFIGHE